MNLVAADIHVVNNKTMVNCEVKFENNPDGVYYSGQTLSGVVEITNDKHRKLRAVTLRIEGFAKVKRITNQLCC